MKDVRIINPEPEMPPQELLDEVFYSFMEVVKETGIDVTDEILQLHKLTFDFGVRCVEAYIKRKNMK